MASEISFCYTKCIPLQDADDYFVAQFPYSKLDGLYKHGE